MNSKYSSTALKKASGIFLCHGELSECLELSSPMVAGKGLLKSAWSLWSPKTALLSVSFAVVTAIHKTCKLEPMVCFLRKIRSTNFYWIYDKLNSACGLWIKKRQQKTGIVKTLYLCLSCHYAAKCYRESEIWFIIWYLGTACAKHVCVQVEMILFTGCFQRPW